MAIPPLSAPDNENPTLSAAPEPEPAGPRMLRALKSRNYRLYFGGQGVSLVGTWMTRIATSWLVYRLTGSALLLGVVSFAGQIPTFVLAPFAGVLVDRVDKHRMLVWTQVLAMLQSFAMAILALLHVITVPEVIGLSLFQGFINAFDMPSRQAFLVEMVDRREDLGNAIALNSSLVNGARLLGPSIGGILIAAVGEGWCFFIDGASYLAVIASLLMMRVVRKARPAGEPKRGLHQLKEGWRYVSRFAPIRTILLLLALVSLMGMPYTVLMPVIASKTLHGGPALLGALMAATGIGALCGALYLAQRTTVLGLGRVIPASAGIFGAGLAAFSFTRVPWIAVVCLVVVGFGMMVQMAASNTILQTIVDDDKRGRVMSFYSMAFMGMAPFGGLLAGALAHRIGAEHTVLVSGTCCMLAAAWFATRLPMLRHEIRPIYREIGVLPPVEEDA
ncbi:MFS transporter [Longimicrobium sp.]|uniref:MFS transporter n=1 Tax=Longimicrobium sp. TaxID=2029185 RepID=UPI002D060FB8|nr:MFS transporter [Longimicrobium sp.]HSU12707.1 MFS transporter [Longimicrobium sp.]